MYSLSLVGLSMLLGEVPVTEVPGVPAEVVARLATGRSGCVAMARDGKSTATIIEGGSPSFDRDQHLLVVTDLRTGEPRADASLFEVGVGTQLARWPEPARTIAMMDPLPCQTATLGHDTLIVPMSRPVTITVKNQRITAPDRGFAGASLRWRCDNDMAQVDSVSGWRPVYDFGVTPDGADEKLLRASSTRPEDRCSSTLEARATRRRRARWSCSTRLPSSSAQPPRRDISGCPRLARAWPARRILRSGR